jgi:hypothetical protein
MATEKQRDANLANAKKSTGPRSQWGKARSRLNSQKHGLTAKTLIFVGEHADDFEQLRAAHMIRNARLNASSLSASPGFFGACVVYPSLRQQSLMPATGMSSPQALIGSQRKPKRSKRKRAKTRPTGRRRSSSAAPSLMTRPIVMRSGSSRDTRQP